MLFKRGDCIELKNGRQYEAICVDDSTAVFAPIKIRKRDGAVNTTYRGMFAYPNWDDNSHAIPADEYKRIERSDIR